MELVSVIIPIYNAEKYIHRCLDSILAQTHTNWEAILVDDGSSDNSGAICDEYAAKDKRCKVIHQKNGGVSVARQTGLDNTNGDYVIHCDPDDWVEPNMLEDMLQCATANNADMVICDFINEEKEEITYCSQGLKNPITAKEAQALIIKDKLHGSCCNKLIKKSCIANIGFTPASVTLCEDELFNIRVLCNDMKVVYLPKAFYHYNIGNNDSICHSYNIKTILSKKTVIAECEKLIDKKEFNNMYDMKKSVLNQLFLTRHFEDLRTTYPEIHQIIIKQNVRYYFFTPLGFFLAKALKHSPHLYYNLYNANIHCIKLYQRIKRLITN